MNTKHKELADEVLRKIGRNVLLIQKVEGLLKLLIPRASISGKHSELKDIISDRESKVASQTMGTLVKNFTSAFYLDTETEELSDDSEEISFSYNFRVDADDEAIKKRQEELKEIVEERNLLIHQQLIHLNLDSEESCNEMSDRLDSQFEKLRSEHEKLRLTAKSFFELTQEALEEMKKQMIDGNNQ